MPAVDPADCAVGASTAADCAEDAGATAKPAATTDAVAGATPVAAVLAPLDAIGTSAVAESAAPAAVAAAVGCLPKITSRSRMALLHRAHRRRRCLCCVSSDWFDSTLLSVVSACSLTVR